MTTGDMSGFRIQLFDEHEDLLRRIKNLKQFIISDEYDLLPDYDRKDLKEQLQHMEAYCAVLSRRASRQCSNA
jgi:hypothetical protein